MQLPIITFIQTQLAEADPAFDTREGTAFYDLFIIPQQFMLQPLNDFMAQRRIGQSIRQMLMDPTPDTPTTFQSTDADDAAGNLYVTRDTGSIATGVVRVYYITPIDIEFPALTAQFTSGTLNFFNSSDFTLTAAQMTLQTDGSLFFADIPIKAEQAGAQYTVGPGSITAFVNGGTAVRVTNIAATSVALNPETNTGLLTRTGNSIGVRDLETTKGINAILSQLFPFLQEIVSIGMGDPEMQRDIQYNIHTGARTDVYLKTPALTTGTFTVKNLVTDTTRSVFRNLFLAVARNSSDPLYPPFTGTPSIVTNSEFLEENVIETAATITSVPVPPTIGIDLTGHEWLNIAVDAGPNIQVKVSGATVSATQKFEIINSINAAVGLAIVAPGPADTIVMTSPTIGQGSQLRFNNLISPIVTTENASNVLFGISIGSLPVTLTGVVAARYMNTIDYIVDYPNGKIFQTSYVLGTRDPLSTGRQTILTGQTMIAGAATGSLALTGGLGYLNDSISSKFLNDPMIHVRAGDQVTISEINGFTSGTVNGIPIPSTYSVAQVVTTQQLRLANFIPTAGTAPNTVTYTIVSNQVVKTSYQYNPISVDIGGQVLLSDGLTRGIRPGRTAYTITDTPFVKIVSIQEIDPDTGEFIGNPLTPPQGYGDGGYGQGGYGIGNSGDYNFIVNVPNTRFSVFEDSMIVFSEAALGSSFIITYLWNPELVGIHAVTRDDGERVTGADILVKVFIPCFVDMTITGRKLASNTLAPKDAVLTAAVQNYVNGQDGVAGVDESEIIDILRANNVDSVQNPFVMLGTILNPDGSTTIIQSQDILKPPTVSLPSQTNNFTTPRIVHFFPGAITVTTAVT